ncbi:DUF262 domain-containing protein [Allorhizocola rhizosphaerae]|uniref:DUF262 domain-containing protein n=1 Tax=Allorhizocola rhizosphaerae TaxID=1872709 RepID=UPI0013C29F62|nr:DUF262 domain-containing protein [Allorhizocola rhizosphaerae]
MGLTESVSDVLRPRLLTIPDYQRGYAWEREHVDDFLDDLRLLQPGKSHYTGTIVLLGGGQPLVDDESNALAHADIVDGQQRLTTICLLLNELRRAFLSVGDDAAAHGLRRQFLVISKNGVPQNKLQVGSDARPVRDALLNDGPDVSPETLSAERLLMAARQMRSHVRTLVEGASDPVAVLRDLRDRIITGLHFTLYTLDQQAEVGVIFETLNDRGKPLTELEKVKNYLLFLAARLPAAQQAALAKRINDAWTLVYRLLLEVARVSPAGEDQFLRAHWLATVDPVPTKWAGTKSIKSRFPRDKYVESPDMLIVDIGNYVDSLARAARAFADSLRPDLQAFHSFGPTNAHAARALHDRLSRAGTVAVFQPLMIALRERWPNDGGAYVRIFDLCERFAVRTYVIGGYRADAGQTRLYRLAHEVYCGVRDSSMLEAALRKLVHEYANDSYVRQELLDTEYNWYRWPHLRFFLYEYEIHLLTGAMPDIGYGYFGKSKREKTVEHVLPQTATSRYWRQRFTKEQRRTYIHALGNLVLTRDNSSYSNKDFPDKRGSSGPSVSSSTCYAQAPLQQEQELALLDEWTPETILARQERLADWALERWSVDFSDLEDEGSVEPERDLAEDEPDEPNIELLVMPG